MPLLFVIAGAGLWFAAQCRSRVELLRERTERLLVPAIAGMFLIVPPQVFIERVAHGAWSAGYGDFFVQQRAALRALSRRRLQLAPLVVHLSVHVRVAPAAVARRAPAHVARSEARRMLPLGINEALLEPRFPETHNLVSDWYTFNHYLLLTLYGIGIASMREAWDWFAQWRRVSLAAAMGLFASGLALFETGIVARDTPALDARRRGRPPRVTM